ncbi:MAG TPA: outer membrane beta-barrel protein [Povalibacter sp.]|uniref:outer membrane beta-barrel protein n=1 Tax=Povalibacter sp. TaxID=1962978 RepID=UPI002B576B06|nr:outer membrane beta-barrel protein [Povalibacter sp.]HMN43555.1 outer membrane beta-barrel protein [Povalibacter sp.]
MRKSVLLAAALFGPALLTGMGARAADNGFYLGAGVGQANVDVDAIGVDGDDTGFKAIAGFRPLDFFAVELNYIDFGSVEDRGAKVDADAIAAFAVGFLPVGPVDLYAKAGLADSDASARIGALRADSDGTDFAYGVGVQFRFLSLSARLEYEKFDLDDVDDLNLLTLGLTYTFL